MLAFAVGVVANSSRAGRHDDGGGVSQTETDVTRTTGDRSKRRRVVVVAVVDESRASGGERFRPLWTLMYMYGLLSEAGRGGAPS